MNVLDDVAASEHYKSHRMLHHCSQKGNNKFNMTSVIAQTCRCKKNSRI